MFGIEDRMGLFSHASSSFFHLSSSTEPGSRGGDESDLQPVAIRCQWEWGRR